MPGYHRGRGGAWTKNTRTRRKRNKKKKKDTPKGVPVPPPSNSSPAPSPAPSPASSPTQVDQKRSSASSFSSPVAPQRRMGFLRYCLRCKKEDVIKDEDDVMAICRSCDLKGPLSQLCPDVRCLSNHEDGGRQHMFPWAFGDFCTVCKQEFHFCSSCGKFCQFSENPCIARADSPVTWPDTPPNEHFRPDSVLPDHQPLGEKRPLNSSSTSPSSKKPRADSKNSPSSSTHKEPEVPSTSPDSLDAGFTLENSTLDDFSTSYEVFGLSDVPFSWDSKD